MFAVVHCPNFFVQCEQLFSLSNKAVVVATNDGLDEQKIIASSTKAQELGFKPGLTNEELADAHYALPSNTDLKLCSPNYEFYADVSERFIKSIELLAPSTSVYSYDEVYIDLQNTNSPYLTNNQSFKEYAHNIQQLIKQWLGISSVIGLAPTRTLAKLACNAALWCDEYNGVVVIEQLGESHSILERISINDIDGISKKEASKLSELNIRNALELSLAPKHQVRRRCSVIIERIALELAGQPCNGAGVGVNARPNITLGQQTAANTLTETKRALSRQLKAITQTLGSSTLYKSITVALAASPLTPANPLRQNQLTSLLPNTSNSTTKLEKLTSQILDSLWDERQNYHSLSVELEYLNAAIDSQCTLFFSNDSMLSNDSRKLTSGRFEVLLKPKNSTNTLARRPLRSPSYTTNWADILRVG